MKRICAFYFSATGTTEKIVRKVTAKLLEYFKEAEFFKYDFSSPKSREEMPSFSEGDLLVCAVPTYAGRVPSLLLKYLSRIDAKGAFAIPLVLYGNRSPDDCLMELSLLLMQGGAKLIAGGTFIGEHSFSKILAKARPDERDFFVAEKLAETAYEKISKKDFSEPKFPGENPIRPYFTPRDRYGKGIDFVKIKPLTNENCTNCKICVRACPLGSIDYDDPSKIIGKCMKCCACVKKCPEEAKFFDDAGYLYHLHELEDLYGAEKQSEIFF